MESKATAAAELRAKLFTKYLQIEHCTGILSCPVKIDLSEPYRGLGKDSDVETSIKNLPSNFAISLGE
jgi:hypothetical protein